MLDSWIEEVEEDWPETGQASDGSNADDDMVHKSNRDFVIHGHDGAARETVVRFYDRVVYTKLDDAGAWKMKLVRELKAAGFGVDANRVVQT